jgi:predicted HAD superfamily hydrolase
MSVNKAMFSIAGLGLDKFPDILVLEQQILAADAVSFDFFDTLFVRSVIDPEDVFDIVGNYFGITDFKNMRRAAQSEAFRRMHLEGKKEITLAGIYECFESLTVPAINVMQKELEVELAIVHPNAELLDIFLRIIATGKQVVLISDMYLTSEFFHEAFRLHGLPMIPFFISADSNATKRDCGELFDIVIKALGLKSERILHIGDNINSDINQAKAKGLKAFHYLEQRQPLPLHYKNPAASISRALLRKNTNTISPETFKELGFLYAGPAVMGYLQWIAKQAKTDQVDHILFVARDGYVLNQIAKLIPNINLPPFSYFLGSRVSFTMAAIDDHNFVEFLDFLLSGADGLSTHELLERIGVAPPTDDVLKDLGLDGVYTDKDKKKYEEFLYAYRWEILKVSRVNRRALLVYLLSLKIVPGSCVAIVDIGWNGTTQVTMEKAIANIMDIHVVGYNFCLTQKAECVERRRHSKMTAMFSTDCVSEELIDQIYTNRVAIEALFSAPHSSVIGLKLSSDGQVIAVEDARSSISSELIGVSAAIAEGVEVFASSYIALQNLIGLENSPIDLAMPLVEFAIDLSWRQNKLLMSITNFDGWGLTCNNVVSIVEQ